MIVSFCCGAFVVGVKSCSVIGFVDCLAVVCWLVAACLVWFVAVGASLLAL